ncbi:hypothetical protein GmHk_15G044946 [Glycine max]|nr:hypothetical protein GmHk_15G044946 [Glycine max]
MCAPTVRKLCTLSNLFHSKLLTRNCNNTNVAPFTKPFPESEDEIHLSSEPDLARDTSKDVPFFKFQFLRLPIELDHLFSSPFVDPPKDDAKSSDMSIEKKIEFPESSTGKDKEALVSNCSRAGDEVPPSTFSMMNIDEDRLSFHTSTDGYGYLLATLCSFIAYLFILYTGMTI